MPQRTKPIPASNEWLLCRRDVEKIIIRELSRGGRREGWHMAPGQQRAALVIEDTEAIAGEWGLPLFLLASRRQLPKVMRVDLIEFLHEDPPRRTRALAAIADYWKRRREKASFRCALGILPCAMLWASEHPGKRWRPNLNELLRLVELSDGARRKVRQTMAQLGVPAEAARRGTPTFSLKDVKNGLALIRATKN